MVILRLTAQLALETLNRREVGRNSTRYPEALTGVMDATTFARSGEYTLAKGQFASVEAVYDAVVLLLLLCSGILPWLWAGFTVHGAGATWRGALSLVIIMILLGLLSLPLEWWSRFRLEERFGFNKSSLGLWTVDQIKFALLGLGLGFPIMWAILALADWVGPFWWVCAFALLFGFQLCTHDSVLSAVHLAMV